MFDLEVREYILSWALSLAPHPDANRYQFFL